MTGAPRDPANHPRRVIERCQREGRPVHVSGPMVRYSKLPFRELVRYYNCDIVYTPMILAREFVRNQVARESDLTTNAGDTPVIVQLGVSNELDITRAAALLAPYCDGIGINCGCPIPQQNRGGIGAALMSSPDHVADMVRAVKKTLGNEFCVEVKIRILHTIDDTLVYARKIEASGADFLTVHGRLKTQRSSEPPNYAAIRTVKEALSIPVVANGDAFSSVNVDDIVDKTGCDGVMSARGILKNPALFAGYKTTPWCCIERFWAIVTAHGLPFRLTQHHLSEMLDNVISKKLKQTMNRCDNLIQLLEWFDDKFDLRRPGDAGFAEDRPLPWKYDAEALLRQDD